MTSYLERNTDFNNPDVVLAFDELSVWSSYFGRMLLDNIRLRKNITVLDIGFGSGFPILELAQRLGTSCTLYGIDIWKEALDRAEQKKEVLALNNVHLLYEDALKMSFEDNKFDLIVSNLGINNFEDPSAVLSECYRVASPGCEIILTTNLNGHMQELYDIYSDVLTDLDLQEFLPVLEKQRTHRGTVSSVSDLLMKAGFKIARKIEDSFTIAYTDGTTMLNHYLTVIGFLSGWKSVVPENKQQQIFAELELRLNKKAESEGSLKMTIPQLYIEALKE